jgi:hypothetical protein
MKETHAEERLSPISTSLTRSSSWRTHAYVCSRQEQHAKDADAFGGLAVALRSLGNSTCDGSIVL